MPSQQLSNQLNLEEELRTRCVAEGLDLHMRLERITKSAERIWALPRLYWFTNHSVTHSKNIIKILGQILSYVQINSQSALTSSELYILLSACYLHDIGMQFLNINNRSAGEFTDSEYEIIRSHHPSKAEMLIIDRAMHHQRDDFRIDLDDEPEYFIPIALVCKAHGSKFFDDTLTELKETKYQPGGSPFRGRLLACLLMLADEFDLHQSRARFPKDMTLSPISALHFHIHSYITGVNILLGETDKDRQVQVDMIFPKDSGKYQGFVMRWLSGKVTKQIRRASRLIYQETNGELSISDKLIFNPETSKNENDPRKLPSEAMNVLIKEVIEFEMVNQDKPREVYSQMLRFPPEVRSLILISPDETAEIESINWLSSHSKYKGVDCYITNFSGEPYTINDLTYKMLHDISITSNAIENPLQVFIDKVNELTQSKQIIFVFQNFNNADDRIAIWVYNVLLRKLKDSTLSTAFVLTCAKRPQMFDDCSRFQEIISWDTITQESIEEVYLSYGFNSSDANLNALRLFTISKGKPENVILGLELERKQWRVMK